MIMKEWTSSRNFQLRVANLRGDTTSGQFSARLNGNIFLRGDAPGVTVFDDAAVDLLSGGADSDWFIFNNDTGVKDIAVDLSGMEKARVVDIDPA
jgi:hypothetical protein